MDKDHDLMPITEHLRRLVKHGFIAVSTQRLRSSFAAAADKVLFEWDRAERRVEIEQALVSVDAEEVADIDVVGKGGRKTYDADRCLS